MSCVRFSAWMLVLLFLLNYFHPNCGAARDTEKGNTSAEQPRSGGTYRIPLMNEPSTLDPAYIEDMYGHSVVQQLFDGLVQFSPDLFVIPDLAENWQVADNGKLYRFFLRPNARFHNGRLVTTQDVVFSLSRLIRANPPPSVLPHLLKISGAQEYRENRSERVAGLTIVDDRIVLIKLEELYTPFLTALAMPHAKIVPREEVESRGTAFGRKPIGNGPFQLASWEANKGIRLVAFKDYYSGVPYLGEIQYLIYPGGKIEDVLSDFQNGRLEEMPVFWQFREKLLADKNLRWLHRPSLSLLFYGINCQYPLLKNVELRKALGAAIDRRQIISEVYKGQFEPALRLLPPGMSGYQPQTGRSSYGQDAAKTSARQAQEGNEQVPTVEIVSNSQSPLAQAELNLVRQAWGRLGINMVPKFIPDWSEFERYLKSDALQIYRYAWFADIPDPDNFLQPLFASDSKVNYMRYHNEWIDATIRKASGIADPIERAKLYQQMEETVAESYPLIPLFYLSVDRVYQPYTRGVEISALGEQAMSYRRVWLTTPSEQ